MIACIIVMKRWKDFNEKESWMYEGTLMFDRNQIKDKYFIKLRLKDSKIQFFMSLTNLKFGILTTSVLILASQMFFEPG